MKVFHYQDLSKLTDVEAEASETQVWFILAKECGYISHEQWLNLDRMYDHIIGQVVLMKQNPKQWTIKRGGAPSPRPTVTPS